MYEVEVKAPVKNFEKAYNYLRKLATRVIRYHVSDTYLMHPCKDFSITDEELRIRSEKKDDERLILTYKGSSLCKDKTAREEIELEIPKDFYKILTKLGFREYVKKEKVGWVFLINDFTITLCEVKGEYRGITVNLGYFVEVELLVREKRDIEKARKEVIEFIRKIPSVGNMDSEYYTEKIIKLAEKVC